MVGKFSTVKGEITIRMASRDDAAIVRSLRLEALSLHPEAFAADLEMSAADGVEDWAERIADYTANSSSSICIALKGDILIGMSGIGRGHWPKTRHSGTIWGVYIKQQWRGLHIAEQLLNGCIEWGKENGISVINLEVNLSNVPAIRCYARSGFTIHGVEPRAIYHEGVYFDELLMAKLI